MSQIIKLKSSSVQSAVPLVGDLIAGELAINTYDGKVFLKKNDGAESIVEIGQAILDSTPTQSSTNGVTSGGVYDSLALKIDSSEKASANGVATLGADLKIPTSQLPALAITETAVVSDEASMLALTAQTGDVAIRTDENKTYILAGTDPSVLADWNEMLTPTDAVLSVNGYTGAITITTSDINEGTNLYYTDARVLAYVGGILNDSGSGTSDLWSADKIANYVSGEVSGVSPHNSTVDPTASDDNTGGYFVGQIWVNTTSDEAFVLVDATTGTAVWVSASSTGSITGGSNVGTAGVGVFKDEVGGVLNFKKLNPASSRVSIIDDTSNDKIDIDVVINDAGTTSGDLWSANKISTRTIDGGTY